MKETCDQIKLEWYGMKLGKITVLVKALIFIVAMLRSFSGWCWTLFLSFFCIQELGMSPVPVSYHQATS